MENVSVHKQGNHQMEDNLKTTFSLAVAHMMNGNVIWIVLDIVFRFTFLRYFVSYREIVRFAGLFLCLTELKIDNYPISACKQETRWRQSLSVIPLWENMELRERGDSVFDIAVSMDLYVQTDLLGSTEDA